MDDIQKASEIVTEILSAMYLSAKEEGMPQNELTMTAERDDGKCYKITIEEMTKPDFDEYNQKRGMHQL